MRIAFSVAALWAVALCGAMIEAQDVPPDAVQIQKLVDAAAAHPQDVNAHFDLALAYSVTKQDALAIPEYRKVLELAPDTYAAHSNLGQVLLRSKRADEALPELRRAHEQKPDQFRPAYYLGEALFDLHQFADALPAYEAAAKIDPKDGDAELGVARTLAKLKRLADAEPHYRQAAQLDPNFRSYLLELAQAHEAAGEIDPAIALYREFPDDPAALEHAGALYLDRGKDADAIALLEPVVRSSPTSANRLALARAYVHQKAFSMAEPLAAALAAAEPRNFDLRMFYGRILRDQHKNQEAARVFEEATRIDPRAAPAWSELAGELILLDQYPAALGALDKVKELGAENEGHLFFRAVTLDHLNRKKEALEYYQRFVEASRTNPDQEFQARQRIQVLERDPGKR